MVVVRIPVAELRELRQIIATLQAALNRSHEQIREALGTIARLNDSKQQIAEQANADRQRLEGQLAEARHRLEQQRAARAAKAQPPACEVPQGLRDLAPLAAQQPAAKVAHARRPILGLPSRIPRP